MCYKNVCLNYRNHFFYKRSSSSKVLKLGGTIHKTLMLCNFQCEPPMCSMLNTKNCLDQ